MGDYISNALLGFSAPSTSTGLSNGNEQSMSPILSRPPTALEDQHLPPPQSNIFQNFNSTFDYAAALQLMQLQMLYQPNFFSTFFNHLTRIEAIKNAYEVQEVPREVCAVTAREFKRIHTKCAPEVAAKRSKCMKRVMNDNETNSPVSGMFIKAASSVPPPELLQAAADLDDTAAFVQISDETRKNIARIPNAIGECICALCKVKYDDVFRLAQHRCPRIIHEEYRCPECDKVFSCPANLASHRRWHKPKSSTADVFQCSNCSAAFETKKTLRSHLTKCFTVQSPAQTGI